MNVRRNRGSVKRSYHSPRREEQAKATRAAILNAAHELFLANGYAETSIDAIADRARVSRQTVYDSVGDKASLLYAVGERVVMSQDDVGPITESDRWSPLTEEPDRAERIRMAVRMSREMWQSGMADFEWMTYEAASSDPRLKEILAEAIQEKRRNSEAVARLLVPEDSPISDERFQKVVDLITAIDSAYVVRTLTNDFGWTYDDYEEWLARIVHGLLLQPEKTEPKDRLP